MGKGASARASSLCSSEPMSTPACPVPLSLAVLLPVVIGEAARLHVELTSAAGTGGRTVRPSEVVRALWPHLGDGRLRRVFQWIDCDDERREPSPLPPTAAVALHALSRAPLFRSPHAGTDSTLGGGRDHPARLRSAEPAQATG